jgi:hypothetical protein
MKPHRFAITAVLTLAVGALVAAPAGAATAPLTSGASFARTVPFIDGTIYAFECHAAAPDATTTAIGSCVVTDGFHNIAAPPRTSSGSVATTDSAVATTPLSEWKVCWTARADYADGSSQSKSGCTTSSSLAGAGAA